MIVGICYPVGGGEGGNHYIHLANFFDQFAAVKKLLS